MAQPKSLPLEKNFIIDNGVRDKNHIYKDGEYIEVAYQYQEYPKFVNGRIAENAEQEAELRKGEEVKGKK